MAPTSATRYVLLKAPISGIAAQSQDDHKRGSP